MQAPKGTASEIAHQLHLAPVTLFVYNFLINCPNSKMFGCRWALKKKKISLYAIKVFYGFFKRELYSILNTLNVKKRY